PRCARSARWDRSGEARCGSPSAGRAGAWRRSPMTRAFAPGATSSLSGTRSCCAISTACLRHSRGASSNDHCRTAWNREPPLRTTLLVASHARLLYSFNASPTLPPAGGASAMLGNLSTLTVALLASSAAFAQAKLLPADRPIEQAIDHYIDAK